MSAGLLVRAHYGCRCDLIVDRGLSPSKFFYSHCRHITNRVLRAKVYLRKIHSLTNLYKLALGCALSFANRTVRIVIVRMLTRFSHFCVCVFFFFLHRLLFPYLSGLRHCHLAIRFAPLPVKRLRV